jgi:hypothetical protein
MIKYNVLCSSQDHLRTGTHDLDHPVLAGAENTDKFKYGKSKSIATSCLRLFLK